VTRKTDEADSTGARRVLAPLVLIFVLVMNGMAGSGALSGESIGLIANRYSNAFLPAGYVFSIWSLIYAALIAYSIDHTLRVGAPVHVRVGWHWVANGLLNVAWVTTFAFSLFLPALLIMVGLLANLIAIHVGIGDPRRLERRDRLLVALPFGLYLSWISVALIANVFHVATVFEWDGFGASEHFWSPVMMAVATCLGAFMWWRRGVWVFPLVVVWALVGIAVRWNGDPSLTIPAWTLTLLGAVVFAAGFFRKRRGGTVAASLLALLLVAPSALHAQEGSLRGRILDEADLRSLQGATVTVLQTGAQVLTNEDGRFGFDGLPSGLVSVRVEYIGYESSLKAEIAVQSSRSTYVEFRLRRQAIEIQGIVVGAPAFGIPEAAPTSIQILSNEELRRTPGGLLDISRTLLSLPGVLGGVDNRNDLLVRGGGPGENAYYVDGIRVPQINHFATQGASGGALGLVNVDFIRETEFFTGAFPARYGDAMSSVLSIDNRPGSEDAIHGDVTLGATEAAITLDGPAGEDANWLFSLRRSYLQFLFEALGLPIRPDYWDGQFRFEYEPTDKDRFLVMGLGAIDNFGLVAPVPGDDYENFEIFERVIDNDQKSLTLGGSWRRLISGGYLTSTVSWSGTDYSFEDPGADSLPVLVNESWERDARASVEANLALGDRASLDVGVDADRASLDVRLFQRAIPGGTLPEDLAWDAETATWKVASHAQVTGDVGSRVTLSGGVRADEVSGLEQGLALSPRLSATVALGGDVSLQAAAGAFHQAPSLLSLSVSENGAPVNLGLRQQRNRQLVGGASWIVNPGLRLSVEGFWKEYDRVPVLRDDPRIALPNLGGDYGFVGAEPLADDGTGRANGLEVFAQQKLLGQVYFLGAYTWSRSTFAGSDGVLRPSAWDRRHALDLTSGFRPGAWEFGAKVRWLSGLATTPWDIPASQASYPITGRGVPDWGGVGEVRTPAYLRLDVRVDRRFTRSGWNAVFYVDLQNILNRENVVGFTYTENPAYPDRIQPIDGSGFLPTFGFSIEF
jgi:hypothetical protein